MKLVTSPNRTSLSIAVLATLAAVCSLPAYAGTVTLNPGANVQAAVNAAPAGTRFNLTAGTYRMQSVKPKANDVFAGQGVVIFNGSQVLSFKTSGTQYVATAKFDNFQHGNCQTAYPLCGWDQDLFIDNVLQTKATSAAGLLAGSWFYDHATNTVYIPTNPAGHTVEIGMSTYAFYGSAPTVTIANIIVEKYANPGQTGAFGGDGPGWANGLGYGWLIENCEARFNHGAGAYVGPGDKIYKTYLHNNGQQGIKATGANINIIDNEISWNNVAGFDSDIEGGGGKIMGTTNLLFQSNYVHDNLGEGLWADTNNIYTTYEDNTFANNENGGLMHEVSYNAVIKNNTFLGNSPHQSVWVENGQILVQNSSNVEVYNNNVQVPATGGNGITVVNQKRGSGEYGSYTVTNVNVHNNTITYLGTTGWSGLGDDTTPYASYNNSFNNNKYILKGGGNVHWFWYRDMTWAMMTQIGKQEAQGSCCN